MNNRKTSYTIISILLCLCGFIPVCADSPCSSFFIKATFHTERGNQESVYLTFDYSHRCFKSTNMYFNGITEYSTIQERIPLAKVNLEKLNTLDSIQYNKILGVNKSVVAGNLNYLDYECNYSDLLPVATNFYNFDYYKSLTNKDKNYLDSIYYAEPVYIDLDTINLITLDSILWCHDFQQIQWLNKKQIEIVKSQKIVSYFRVESDLYYWIDFFSYDPYWTKNRILSYINLEKLGKSLDDGGSDIFNAFTPLLKGAIQTNKILFFVRFTP